MRLQKSKKPLGNGRSKAALVGVERKHYNRDTILCLLSLCICLKKDLFSLFHNEVLIFDMKRTDNSKIFCAFLVETVGQEDLLLSMKQTHKVPVAEHKALNTVFVNAGLSPIQSKIKSENTLIKDGWERLICCSTVFHCLEYAIRCVYPKAKTKGSYACLFACRMTNNCSKNVKTFNLFNESYCHADFAKCIGTLSFSPEDINSPTLLGEYLDDPSSSC